MGAAQKRVKSGPLPDFHIHTLTSQYGALRRAAPLRARRGAKPDDTGATSERTLGPAADKAGRQRPAREWS